MAGVVTTPVPDPDRVVVRATKVLGDRLRPLLARACAATGAHVHLELVPNGPVFRTLRNEQAAPRADLIVTLGPFTAELCARESLVQPVPTDAVPPLVQSGALASREQNWGWQALCFDPVVLIGPDAPASFNDIDNESVPSLAVPDPLRNEASLMVLLATLDRARQVERNVEKGWNAWQDRSGAGMVQTEDDAAALAALQRGEASHALHLGQPTGSQPRGTILADLAPMPQAIGLVKGAPHEAKARQLLAWLVSRDAAAAVEAADGLSAWNAANNGLQALSGTSRTLDVGWCFDQYRAVRAEWGRKPWALPRSL